MEICKQRIYFLKNVMQMLMHKIIKCKSMKDMFSMVKEQAKLAINEFKHNIVNHSQSLSELSSSVS